MTQTVRSASAQVRRGDGTALVSTAELPPRGHFIANEFIAEANSESFDIVNPADESVLSSVIVYSSVQASAGV